MSTLGPRPALRALRALVVLGGAVAAPRLAQAQDRATDLFFEALALQDKGNVVAACSKFEESYQVRPLSGTVLNLAKCAEREGKFVKASARWVEAEELATQTGKADQVKAAKEGRARLDARMPELTLRGPPGATLKHVAPDGSYTLLVDGPQPINPGAHRIAVAFPGRVDQTYDITIAEGEKKILDVVTGPQGAQVLWPRPQPTGPQFEMQSTPLLAGGIVLVSLGGLLSLIGIPVLITGQISGDGCEPGSDIFTVTCNGAYRGRDAGLVMTILGLSMVGGGSAMIVYGGERVPVHSGGLVPTLRLGPAYAEATWAF